MSVSEGESKNCGVISMHDFLDFLKVTCQVNDSIDTKNHGRARTAIDYNNLAKNELVNNLIKKSETKKKSAEYEKNGQQSPQTLRKEAGSGDKTFSNISSRRRVSIYKQKKSEVERPRLDIFLNEKLDEVINEGILDSVLPFVCAPSSSTSSITSVAANVKLKTLNSHIGKSTVEINDQQHMNNSNTSTSRRSSGTGEVSSNVSSSHKTTRKKSINSHHEPKHSDPEVVIHVCDEVKGSSRDFKCPQKLLVSKMGYFSDVTAGQRLEDMDISVHCDLQIFEWLIKWVKKDEATHEEVPPLDPANVIPILVSASFLQMEPLLLDCLSFCHARLNEVVKASANLACLNESIITRLAAMFTNIELEHVKDKKDRIAPRLWTKMIQSLTEFEPQSLRGHYATLAGLFRCSKCGKYLIQSVNSQVYCVPQNMKLNRWGQLVSSHTRDTTWNLNTYITQLHKELRSWRKVYWRLWGHCHFLYCAICETYFPAYQMQWCQYHPEPAQFLGPSSEGRVAGPAGRYPCCNQQAYRYETVVGTSGCQYRDHAVHIENERDRAILHLAMVIAENDCLYETPVMKTTNSYNNGVAPEPFWQGIALIPHRSRQGLLPSFHIDGHRKTTYIARQTSHTIDSDESNSDSDEYDKNLSASSNSTNDSSDGDESVTNSPKNFSKKKIIKNANKATYGRNWCGDMSARSNQDNQREFEERAMKQVIELVGKKTGSDHNLAFQSYVQGGTFIKLETEWRENVKQKGSSSSTKVKCTTK